MNSMVMNAGGAIAVMHGKALCKLFCEVILGFEHCEFINTYLSTLYIFFLVIQASLVQNVGSTTLMCHLVHLTHLLY